MTGNQCFTVLACQPLTLCMAAGCMQMVPRGWWKNGLLADLKYYMPFSKDTVAQEASA